MGNLLFALCASPTSLSTGSSSLSVDTGTSENGDNIGTSRATMTTKEHWGLGDNKEHRATTTTADDGLAGPERGGDGPERAAR